MGVSNIGLVDLGAQYREIQGEVDGAIARVLRSSNFILGPEVRAFEEEFAAYCGVRYAIGVSSGSSALLLALLAAGIGPGDEVITSPLTFPATTEAISHAGATVKFVDIDPASGNLDPRLLTDAMSSKTKCILPVHLYGQPAQMDVICEIAEARGLLVIEDAAQAHGARYGRQRVGSFGAAGCFSFFPSKNLGCYGDGGMVVTNDLGVADKVRLLRAHGQLAKYQHVIEGYGERLDELQAAVLRVKLRHLDAWNDCRRQLASLYGALLKGSSLTILGVHPKAQHVYHLYVVLAKDREPLRNKLKERGIATGLHYPLPLHLQKAYHHLGLGPGSFPRAERFSATVLSLPMYPELSAPQVAVVAAAIHEIDGSSGGSGAFSAA